MICNTTLKEMGVLLKNAERILIFPHTNPDGDALGSAAALCRGLRNQGKTAWILTEEIPGYLAFMDTEFCTSDADMMVEPDVCICVDCSEESRFPRFADKYRTGKQRLCVDHHATGGSFGDFYYIDPQEAATAQIIYKMLLDMGADIDKTIAESLYAGISSDTGSFQYSNTDWETHAIAAALFKTGFDHMDVTVRLYQNVGLNKIKLESKILDRMELLADGKAAISYVTGEMLQELSASLDDAESAIDTLRNIEGVEIAAFLKEKDDGIKVSMRAKSYGNVADIALKFGGGGHAKAAGCTLKMCMEEAMARLKQEINDYLEEGTVDLEAR